MKTNAIVRIVLLSLLALVLIGILLTGILADTFVFHISGSSGTTIEYEASVDAATVRNIEINWACGNVVVKTENVDQIIFRETADTDIKHPMTYNCTDGELELNYSNATVSFGFNNQQEKNLMVIVPLDWVCRELTIDGAALDVTINGLSIGELSIDGAATRLNFSGSVDVLDIDGAGCEVQLNCVSSPNTISMDGAGCELTVMLPKDCGFLVQMDGLGCSFHSDMECSGSNNTYSYGDRYCRINVDGLGCDVSIRESASNNTAFSVRCGDDFTASMLMEPPEEEYAPGTVITLKTDVLTDVDLELYVNGVFVCTQTEYRSPDGSNHWEFHFTMPDEPVVIQFKTMDGILR